MNSPKRKSKPNWTQDQLLLAQLVLKKKPPKKQKHHKMEIRHWDIKQKSHMGEDCSQINATIPLESWTPDFKMRWYTLQSFVNRSSQLLLSCHRLRFYILG